MEAVREPPVQTLGVALAQSVIERLGSVEDASAKRWTGTVVGGCALELANSRFERARFPACILRRLLGLGGLLLRASSGLSRLDDRIGCTRGFDSAASRIIPMARDEAKSKGKCGFIACILRCCAS